MPTVYPFILTDIKETIFGLAAPIAVDKILVAKGSIKEKEFEMCIEDGDLLTHDTAFPASVKRRAIPELGERVYTDGEALYVALPKDGVTIFSISVVDTRTNMLYNSAEGDLPQVIWDVSSCLDHGIDKLTLINADTALLVNHDGFCFEIPHAEGYLGVRYLVRAICILTREAIYVKPLKQTAVRRVVLKADEVPLGLAAHFTKIDDTYYVTDLQNNKLGIWSPNRWAELTPIHGTGNKS